MTTRKLFISLVAAAAALTACTNDDNVSGRQQPTPGAEARTYTVSIPATIGGAEAQTRAVTFGGTESAPTATGRFDDSEKIYVCNETTGAMLLGYLQPTSISDDGKHCQLEGTLTGTVTAGNTLTLAYNMNQFNASDINSCYFNYDGQDGTEAGVIDGGLATGLTATVSFDSEGVLTTEETADFAMQQAIFRLKFTDGTNPITVKKLRIESTTSGGIVVTHYPFKAESDRYYGGQIDVNPTTPTSDYLYVALSINESATPSALKFTVTDNENIVYTLTKAAPSGGFKNGNYYYSTAATALTASVIKPTITWTSVDAAVTPNSNNLYDVYGPGRNTPSEITISGISTGYRFYMNGGATIHLNNLTATFDDQEFIFSDGNLNLDISGANNITCKNFSPTVIVNGTLKLSGIGTLTVTANNNDYYGIFTSNYDGFNNTDPSVLAATGYTVLRSDATSNADGTYTWMYTVAPTAIIKNLAAVTELTAADGDMLTGKLGGSEASNTGNVKIAAGATVTLLDVDITAVKADNSNPMACIECLGDATIILSGSSKLKATYGTFKPAILIPSGHKLTIKGSGSIEAEGYGAGIGGGNDDDCGNIEILSGDITARSFTLGAGIGSGDSHSCGTITIKGGNVTAIGSALGSGIGSGNGGSCGGISIEGGNVTATGAYGAGIGSGRNGSCGDISITGGNVTAKSTMGAGIGKGYDGSCSKVTIGGTMYYDGTGYTDDAAEAYLQQKEIVYPAP